jgi:HlyD family secretion protein
MKKIVLFLIILGLGSGGFVYWKSSQSEPTDRIRISGNIELTQINIAFKTAGKLIDVAVTEGSHVEKGQVIARLDTEQLLRQKDNALATLAGAQSVLLQTQTALQYQTQALAADTDARTADISVADARLRELKAGARPQEVQEARSVVEAAKSDYERAKKDWERAQTLHKNDDISSAQFDAARTRFETSEATFSQARERAALVLAGARTEQVDGASAQLNRAKAGLRASEAGKLELLRRQQELVARQADINRAKSQLALIETQLADLTATSPISGVVLVKSADPGEVLAPGTSVATIGDLAKPWMRGYINAKDLGRVKMGSKAIVTTDAYPGKQYNGRVSFISSDAEFTPKQIQTSEERVKLVYRIKIEVDNPNQELKSNMPADAELLLDK